MANVERIMVVKAHTPPGINQAHKLCSPRSPSLLLNTPVLHVCALGHFSHVRLSETLWTDGRQAPPSMGFSRQESWSGLLCPPRDLPDPGIQQCPLTALAGRFITASAPWGFPKHCEHYHNKL